MDTLQSILNILDHSICDCDETYNAFRLRLNEGLLTRDENPKTHFCVYFLPYNPKNKKVFVIHHKKSGLWLSPGGHINKDETLLQALNREIGEELGIDNFFKRAPSPFLLTTTPIDNNTQPCKMHYDIWYLINTDGNTFNVDPAEFLDVKWLMVKDAKNIVKDPANLKALAIIEKP